MKRKLSKFTLRINAELFDKFRYIAEYHARSVNKELGVLIKKRIVKFEMQNDDTLYDDSPNLMPSKRR